MITSQHNAISIIILGAGSSSRMGQPKQRITLNGYPLLAQAVITAKNSAASHVLVVLGSGAVENKQVIENLGVEIVFHDGWAEGMGSSLKKGLTSCQEKFPETQAILVMVCDQPSITTQHLNTLMDTYTKTQKSVVASHYALTLGVPAVFDGSLFPEILHMANDQGAKNIILNNQAKRVAIDLPGGEIDLDTPEDLKRYREQDEHT